MTSPHIHHWKITNYEPDIDRGVCECGAVCFYPGYAVDKEEQAELNARLKVLAELEAKAGDKVTHSSLSIPPKPTKNGLTRGEWMNALHSYYKENSQAILDYADKHGEAAMMRDWQIFSSTWSYLKDRWRPISKKTEVHQPPVKTGKNQTDPVSILAFTLQLKYELERMNKELSLLEDQISKLNTKKEALNKYIMSLEVVLSKSQELYP